MNYYNDSEPYVCRWLETLILFGHIPNGIVDSRPIQEVTQSDVQGFTQCHFFAGIGGWPLALRLAGWPDNKPVWTGSCPCQPFSVAGKRKGKKDSRHLWPELRRLISLRRPPVVFGEQVASKDGRKWLTGVSTDLEKLVYATGCADLCAPGVGAPHIRQRLWWVAESHGGECGNGELQRSREHRFFTEDGWLSTGSMANGERPGLEEREIESAREEFTAIERSSDVGNGMAHGKEYGPGQIGKNKSRGDSGNETERWATGFTVCSSISGLAQPRYVIGRNQKSRHGGENEKRDVGSNQVSGYSKISGYWDDFQIIPCLDNKYRRIEPGTFPLAHGVSARMGKLRAYGNAIVPQVAAEFIKAYMETIP